MSPVKAGQILTVGNNYLLDRLQTTGPGNVDVPSTTIYEVGNAQSVDVLYDIPNLSFDMESFDVSAEIEAILTGADPTTVTNGQLFNLLNAMPLDVISPFKTSLSNYAVVTGAAVPYLTLESAQYRFGVRDNAAQTYTLRGDSVYYITGSPRYERKSLTAGASQSYTFTNTALPITENGATLYALGVCVKNPTTKVYKRLFLGADFTNTSAGITIIADQSGAGYTHVDLVYGTATVDTYAQTVHPSSAVKPGAVRGRDIDFYISSGGATPTYTLWHSVQNVELNWRVNLDPNEELGNPHYTSQDYDVPEVSGSVSLRTVDAAELWAKINTIAGVGGSIASPLTTATLGCKVKIRHPTTGTVLKTFVVPDAKFTVPGFSAQVQQKLEVTLNLNSVGGNLYIYNGDF